MDLIPGITGYWQVLGRTTIPFEEMLEIDYAYVASWSMLHDIELLMRTVPAVLRRRGANRTQILFAALPLIGWGRHWLDLIAAGLSTGRFRRGPVALAEALYRAWDADVSHFFWLALRDNAPDQKCHSAKRSRPASSSAERPLPKTGPSRICTRSDFHSSLTHVRAASSSGQDTE